MFCSLTTVKPWGKLGLIEILLRVLHLLAHVQHPQHHFITQCSLGVNIFATFFLVPICLKEIYFHLLSIKHSYDQ